MRPHRIEAAHPIAFTRGCKEPKPFLGNLPGVADVVIVGYFLQREDHERKGREFIGKCIVEDIGEVLSELPMFTGTNPKFANCLTYIPPASRKMKQGVYPTFPFPDRRVVGEIDASVGYV